MARNQKLELQWIGKDQRPRLEPRILLEDPALSYHAAHRVGPNDLFDNRLIFGDNLLALKALEQEFSGRIKCIYIDPPYNTGSAFEHYDDGVEHSLWLSLMRDRLELLKRLLATDGSIWISIDDNEMAYLRLLLDEVFGRENFIATVIWRKNDGPKSSARHLSVDHDYILVFAKSAEVWRPNELPRTEKQNAIYTNRDNDPRGPWWADNMSARNKYSLGVYPITTPSGRVIPGPPSGRYWAVSKEKLEALDADGRIWWGKAGNNVPTLKRFLNEVRQGRVPQTFWDYGDVGSTRESKKEAVALNGESVFGTPKPERLIQRILQIATKVGDTVLDSFAGSGTTGAVAHKMSRRWIMVELGEHATTHIAPRMRKVVDGTDAGGITEAVDWKGGGGFRYFKLAPSLIEKDKWGNPVINKGYNADMLAEAVCKLEGFTYAPTDIYWQQGYSTERDFIYVTTQKLTRDQLQSLSDEVGDERTLLVCCAAFRAKPDAFANLTIKKIPHAVLSRCEWGRDDYSLQIKNLPAAPDLGVADDEPPAKSAKGKAKKSASDDSLSLFDTAPTK